MRSSSKQTAKNTKGDTEQTNKNKVEKQRINERDSSSKSSNKVEVSLRSFGLPVQLLQQQSGGPPLQLGAPMPMPMGAPHWGPPTRFNINRALQHKPYKGFNLSLLRYLWQQRGAPLGTPQAPTAPKGAPQGPSSPGGDPEAPLGAPQGASETKNEGEAPKGSVVMMKRCTDTAEALEANWRRRLKHLSLCFAEEGVGLLH